MTDYKDLVTALRTKTSRDNRKLLDEAAEAIEQLLRERDAAITDVEFIIAEHLTICEICKNEKDYPMKGKCRECIPDRKNYFEWRGIA